MSKRLILIFVLIIALSQVTYSQEGLLNFLIEQNEAAREKIKTAEFKVKWTATNKTTEGLRNDKGFGDVKIKGNWRLSSKECDATIPSKKEIVTFSYSGKGRSPINIKRFSFMKNRLI